MQKPAVRHFMTFFLLLLYINRGFFISSADEMNNTNGEINSVAEYLVELITGECNDIDEDGDSQTDCSCVNILQHDFSQHLAQSMELMNLFSKNLKKSGFSTQENPPINEYYCQIEQPPEV